MKHLKCLFLFVVLMGAAGLLQAGEAGHPAKWSWNCKKISGNDYEIVFHLELQKGWYIFADTDDFGIKRKKGHTFIIPTFNLDKSEGVTVKGTVNSKGILETKKIKHIGLANIYGYKVIYVQNVTARPGTSVSGSFSYQVCNDQEVLEVMTEKFSIPIK